MSAINYVIIAIVVAYIAFVIFKRRKDKKEGKSCCGCSTGCKTGGEHSCCSCGSQSLTDDTNSES